VPGYSEIDYLKVDAEGQELAVLEGYLGSFPASELEFSFYPFQRLVQIIMKESFGHKFRVKLNLVRLLFEVEDSRARCLMRGEIGVRTTDYRGWGCL